MVKYFTKKAFVDKETGEELKANVATREYIIIKKQKHVKIIETANCTWVEQNIIYICAKTRQGKLFE